MHVTILILSLIGSLGLFLFGMKVMSEGILKVAGSGLRKMMTRITSGRWKGFATGLVSTGILQSSTAITVLTVSMVNAEILTLPASISIILGANIGTTVTGWLVSILGLQLHFTSLPLLLLAVAVPLNLAGKGHARNWSEFIIGFALLFLGLQLLKDSLPNIQDEPEIMHWLSSIPEQYAHSGFIFLIAGTLITMIFQSSSAVMSLTLVLAVGRLISFSDAAAMIIGLNIGTTFSANLAAMVAGRKARVAARVHFLFNLFGAAWVFPILPYGVKVIEWLMMSAGFDSPLAEVSLAPVGLSLFHSLFNISNVVLQFGFMRQLEAAGQLLVRKQAGNRKKTAGLTYINSGLMSTSEISLVQASGEIKRMFALAKDSLLRSIRLLSEMQPHKAEKIRKHLLKNEASSGQIEKEINRFLLRIAEGNISHQANKEIKTMIRVVDELESITDYCLNLANTLESKNKAGIWFNQEIRDHTTHLLGRTDYLLNIVSQLFNGDSDNTHLRTSSGEVKKEIESISLKLRDEHLTNPDEKEYSYQAGLTYMTLIRNAEKIAEHCMNIIEAME
jgi:phosphate:Na+ symporter